MAAVSQDLQDFSLHRGSGFFYCRLSGDKDRQVARQYITPHHAAPFRNAWGGDYVQSHNTGGDVAQPGEACQRAFVLQDRNPRGRIAQCRFGDTKYAAFRIRQADQHLPGFLRVFGRTRDRRTPLTQEPFRLLDPISWQGNQLEANIARHSRGFRIVAVQQNAVPGDETKVAPGGEVGVAFDPARFEPQRILAALRENLPRKTGQIKLYANET